MLSTAFSQIFPKLIHIYYMYNNRYYLLSNSSSSSSKNLVSNCHNLSEILALCMGVRIRLRWCRGGGKGLMWGRG